MVSCKKIGRKKGRKKQITEETPIRSSKRIRATKEAKEQ
jgi:hypothetical protein